MDSPGLGYSYHLPSAGWNLRIRNVLSQFSDLFSEFNKYIAPAYHHDRCERYLRDTRYGNLFNGMTRDELQFNNTNVIS